jgi:hypothetical protein
MTLEVTKSDLKLIVIVSLSRPRELRTSDRHLCPTVLIGARLVKYSDEFCVKF